MFSFAQESTRYCNYSKDKFGKELTFIEPCWLEDYNYDDNTYNQLFIDSLRWAEAHYLDLLKKWEDKIPGERYKTGFRNNPWTPQQARAVLPNALKTELVMTGFISDWEHFFDLRCDKAAHPQARELAVPLKEEFIKRNLINSYYMEGICGDNRFEIIAKAKEDIMSSTNIKSSSDEMKVLDNFLFRCWQMGWLNKYE